LEAAKIVIPRESIAQITGDPDPAVQLSGTGDPEERWFLQELVPGASKTVNLPAAPRDSLVQPEIRVILPDAATATAPQR
jgi:hypothetical protein